MESETFTHFILPLLTTIFSNVTGLILIRLRSEKEKPKQNVEIISTLEDVSGDLADQLKESRRTERATRLIALALVRQLEDAGLSPIARPNGD